MKFPVSEAISSIFRRQIPGLQMRGSSRRWLPWLPFTLMAAVSGWQAVVHGPAPGLWHLLLGGWLVACWLLGLRLVSTALLTALLLAPLTYHFAVRAPGFQRALRSLGESARPEARVEGIVRRREALTPPKAPQAAPNGTDTLGSKKRGRKPSGGVRLLLGNATVWLAGGRHALAEVVVELPRRSAWAFRSGRRVRIGGTLKTAVPGEAAGRKNRTGAPPLLVFRKADYHFQTEPVTPWSGDALRLRLRDRAAYYLSKPALAVYLPIVLGMRDRSGPEARRVTSAFRRVGIAHLFAISGLHVGLLYFLFAAILRAGRWGWCLLPGAGQGWAHSPAAARVLAMTLIWAYIALIGFPLPAVRAALMGSFLIWSGLWGTRSPPLYILLLAGLVILAGDPSQFHGLSFQMSFLAYFFLLHALQSWRPVLVGRPGGSPGPRNRWQWWWRRWWSKTADGVLLNLWMTAFITLGLWPLTVATFGRFSLLVFAGNLLLVPLMALLVLPGGLLALGMSFISLGGPPGGWGEALVFRMMEGVLTGWIWLVEAMERAGSGVIFSAEMTFSPWTITGYYGLLLLVARVLVRARGNLAKNLASF